MTPRPLPQQNRSLSTIAPRLALAVAQERAHAMRNLKRCSCGYGWRITGHEYDTGGCIERLEHAQSVRDHWETRDAATNRRVA